MENKIITGVIGQDPRLDDKVKNGWSIDDILAESAHVNWVKKTMSQLVNYPVWNQHTSLACVAFAKARQLSIRVFQMTGVWIDFSPSSIYQLRANQGGGMYPPNANDIVNDHGATFEAFMKSQNMNEIQINAVKRTPISDLLARGIAEAVVSYMYFPVIDIDRVAQMIESGKAVSLLLFGGKEEYSRLRPVILDPNMTYQSAWLRHEVVAVDYFLDQNGKKMLYINDSAHFGGIPIREFTEEWLIKRCIMADALDIFTFEPGVTDNPRPKYDGSTIISLQKCLRYEGLFPNNVDFVERFGPLTKNALMAFQRKYGLHPTGVPNVGPKTKAKLLELYP